MDPVFTGLLCIAIACVLYLVFSRRQAVVNYPDGPSPLPLIGNMHQVIMAGSLVEFLELNRKRFGNVFTVTFGAVPKVIVSSYDLLQDVFIRNADNTSDRVINILPAHLVDILSATPGLIWASFPHWKSMRTFALNVLREEGMGKSSLEPQILDEVHTYISTFLVPNEGKSFNITDSLTMATSNIISVMAFGQRFHYDDRMFNQLVTAVQSSVKASLRVGATKNMPWLRFLPGDLTGSKLSAQSNEITREAMRRFVADHRIKLDKEHPKDYIDHYLIHMEKEQDKDANSFFSEGNLLTSIVQLFIAGTETTSTALRWAFLYMCLRPDVQAKVQEEIEAVIGSDRQISFKDRLQMPYTDAVFCEVLRMGNIVNVGVPRKLNNDMMIDGKLVPAGAELWMNLYSVMCDANVFDEPYTFKPERFLGLGSANKNRILPFGLGRRVCLGEALARMEFFLFFTSILQRYTVTASHEVAVGRSQLFSLINAPQPYEVVFKPRQLQA